MCPQGGVYVEGAGLTNFVSADAGGIGGPMCAQLSNDFGIYTRSQ